MVSWPQLLGHGDLSHSVKSSQNWTAPGNDNAAKKCHPTHLYIAILGHFLPSSILQRSWKRNPEFIGIFWPPYCLGFLGIESYAKRGWESQTYCVWSLSPMLHWVCSLYELLLRFLITLFRFVSKVLLEIGFLLHGGKHSSDVLIPHVQVLGISSLFFNLNSCSAHLAASLSPS